MNDIKAENGWAWEIKDIPQECAKWKAPRIVCNLEGSYTHCVPKHSEMDGQMDLKQNENTEWHTRETSVSMRYNITCFSGRDFYETPILFYNSPYCDLDNPHVFAIYTSRPYWTSIFDTL